MIFVSTKSKLAKKLAYEISIFKKLYTISPIYEMTVKIVKSITF